MKSFLSHLGTCRSQPQPDVKQWKVMPFNSYSHQGGASSLCRNLQRRLLAEFYLTGSPSLSQTGLVMHGVVKQALQRWEPLPKIINESLHVKEGPVKFPNCTLPSFIHPHQGAANLSAVISDSNCQPVLHACHSRKNSNHPTGFIRIPDPQNYKE